MIRVKQPVFIPLCGTLLFTHDALMKDSETDKALGIGTLTDLF